MFVFVTGVSQSTTTTSNSKTVVNHHHLHQPSVSQATLAIPYNTLLSTQKVLSVTFTTHGGAAHSVFIASAAIHVVFFVFLSPKASPTLRKDHNNNNNDSSTDAVQPNSIRSIGSRDEISKIHGDARSKQRLLRRKL